MYYVLFKLSPNYKPALNFVLGFLTNAYFSRDIVNVAAREHLLV